MKIFQAVLVSLIFVGMISCGPDAVDGGGDVQLQMTAEFSGNSFFINKEYAFPDGRKVRFSKMDFYVSDFVVKDLSQTDGLVSDLEEVGFVNLSSSEINPLDPSEYSLNSLNIPAGNYTNLSFAFGLTDELNAKTPSDSDIGSNNPLSKASHFWEDWSSYIFMKVEGVADFNDNGELEPEETFIYHTGKSGNEKRVSLNTSINLLADDLTEINVALDVVSMFYDEDGQARFDMSEDRSVHSENGLEVIDKIMSGAASSFKIK